MVVCLCFLKLERTQLIEIIQGACLETHLSRQSRASPQAVEHGWFLPELSRQLGSLVQVLEHPLPSP